MAKITIDLEKHLEKYIKILHDLTVRLVEVQEMIDSAENESDQVKIDIIHENLKKKTDLLRKASYEIENTKK